MARHGGGGNRSHRGLIIIASIGLALPVQNLPLQRKVGFYITGSKGHTGHGTYTSIALNPLVERSSLIGLATAVDSNGIGHDILG